MHKDNIVLYFIFQKKLFKQATVKDFYTLFTSGLGHHSSFSIAMLIIRPSHIDDIPAITAIYSYYVLNSTCTFELTPPTADEMAKRREDVLSINMPYLVAEEAGSVIGYAYCGTFKPRQAYRFTMESTIYLAKDMCGKGYGRQLLNALVHEAELIGVRKFIAVIADKGNTRSINLHLATGFTHVGILKSCGWKFNQWIDVIFMEKSIGDGDTTSPE